MSLEIRRILYPTDFSESSLHALSHALLLAEHHDAELDLLHALVLHADDAGEDDFPGPAEILERLFEVAGSELAGRLGLDRVRSVKIREIVRRGYSVPEVILDFGKESDADLIVMSTRGRRGLGRFFLGSATEGVVRQAGCPVLTMQSEDEPARLEAIDRILVPVDFSDSSREALLHARELAETFDASLDLLYVVQITSHPYFYVPTRDDVWEQRRRAAADAIEKLAKETLAGGPSYETFVADGRPATEIANFAAERRSELVVIATHGLSGLERVLLGSTTAEVIRTVHCPVFTVRSHGKSLLPSG